MCSLGETTRCSFYLKGHFSNYVRRNFYFVRENRENIRENRKNVQENRENVQENREEFKNSSKICWADDFELT